MHSRRRFPWLALPFALLGAAAGWLACDALHGRGPSPGFQDAEIFAAGSTAILGFLSGLVLSPARPEHEWASPRPSAGLTTVVVLATGLVAGGVIGWGVGASWGLAALAGLLLGVVLVPACALLIAAVQRADRARAGSIVARADQRAVVSLLAASLGGLSALALPAWLGSLDGQAAPPHAALALAAVSGALVLAVLAVDLLAARRVDRLAARVAGEELASTLPTARLDLGLGDEVASQHGQSTAYRGGARTVAFAFGNLDDARAALGRSIARGAVALALIEIVALAHGLARDPSAAASYQAYRCESGLAGACHVAAVMAERAGEPTEDASRLHRLACSAGDERSCSSIELLFRREHPLFY